MNPVTKVGRWRMRVPLMPFTCGSEGSSFSFCCVNSTEGGRGFLVTGVSSTHSLHTHILLGYNWNWTGFLEVCSGSGLNLTGFYFWESIWFRFGLSLNSGSGYCYGCTLLLGVRSGPGLSRTGFYFWKWVRFRFGSSWNSGSISFPAGFSGSSCALNLCRKPSPQSLAEVNGSQQHLSLQLNYPCVSFTYQL